MFLEGKYWLMDSGFTVKSKNHSVLLDEFLWYQLLCDKKRLSETSTGSCQQNIDMNRFYMLEYSCPPLAVQIETLAILNEMEAELKMLEQMGAKAEERAKFILDGYLSCKPVAEPLAQVLADTNSTIVEQTKPERKTYKLKKTIPTAN
jgi:restriction endonuclease S subunit